MDSALHGSRFDKFERYIAVIRVRLHGQLEVPDLTKSSPKSGLRTLT